ncbi:MAG: TolC family protein [Hydrogenophilales bacterium]|nr:TolC family protein [Hydrogenophilales bacterium]
MTPVKNAPRHCVTRLLAGLTLAFVCTAQAAPDQALSLEAALAHATASHPDLRQAEAQGALARADALYAASLDDFQVNLEGSLRTGRNALTDDKFEPDHILRLNARKTLWDGGRIEAGSRAAKLESAGREALLLETRAQRRLGLMARFFDVLLADLRYAADDEAMAVAYVSWDNARERHQLGELTTPALAELEARFQDSRLSRNDSLRRAKEKRALLATAMNRPGELPAELIDPDLKGNDRPLPEFEPLLRAMLSHNPRLIALRQQVAATGARLDAVTSETQPSLEFEAEAAAYSRESYTRDTLRAGFNLVWPLFPGGQVDARKARELAQAQLLQAQVDAQQLTLRQALFEAREEILHLRDTERRAADINVTYRDWALERARAEYELEMKTNLGSGMAETQAAKLRRRAVEYRMALAWEKLEALLGTPLDSLPTEPKK